MRRVIFLDHFDAGAAVLGDLVDVGTLHKAQADVCMPQAVRRTRSAFAVEPKIFLIEDGFEKLALPLRNNEVGGSGRAPFFTKDSRVSDVFVGVCTRAGRSRLLSPLRLPVPPSRLFVEVLDFTVYFVLYSSVIQND